MNAGRRTAGFVILCLITIALAAAFRWRDVVYHPGECCDSYAYGVFAQQLRQHGLSEAFSSDGLRTYGYPAFVSLALAGADLAAENSFGYFVHHLAIAQTALFILSCGALFLSLYETNKTLAWCSAVGLLANPFVVQYLPQRLTEGLTISLAVLLAAIAISLATRPMGWKGRAALLSIGSLIAGFSLEVRPANLTLLSAWVLFAAIFLFLMEGRRILIASIVAISLMVPMLPQIAHNVASHGKFTPLPVADLSGLQLKVGRTTLKYHTDASKKKGLRYPNPFSDDGLGGRAATLALHVFHSVNHDYFFTYIYDLDQWRGVPVNALNHAVLLLGALGAATSLRRRYRVEPFSITLSDTGWIFVATAIAATFALNSVAAVETRFGLLIYAAAGPMAAWSIADARSPKGLLAGAMSLGVIVASISAYLLTGMLLRMGAIP